MVKGAKSETSFFEISKMCYTVLNHLLSADCLRKKRKRGGKTNVLRFLKFLWVAYMRAVALLNRDRHDRLYWSGIFGMAGAACLAVAFIELKLLALTSGLAFCYYGLRHKRIAGD